MSYQDPFAPPDTGLTARRLVGVAAWAALAVAVIGLAFSAAAFRRFSVVAPAGVDAAAVAVAAGCLRHGTRHEHERGRGAAIGAVVVALLALVVVAAAVYVGLREGGDGDHTREPLTTGYLTTLS